MEAKLLILFVVASTASGQQVINPALPAMPPDVNFCLSLSKVERTQNPFCLSQNLAYKCGIFFEKLPGLPELTWSEGLPESLFEKNLDNKTIVELKLPRPGVFNFPEEKNCQSGKTANSRCFAWFFRLKSKNWEDCESNAANINGDQSLGDYFCEQIGNEIYPPGTAPERLEEIKIAFYKSECGSPWEPIISVAGKYEMKENLCCKRDARGYYQYPCSRPRGSRWDCAQNCRVGKKGNCRRNS